jgi:O-antigen/teichoic acid export membrane protein
MIQSTHDRLVEQSTVQDHREPPRLRDRILRASGWAGGGFFVDKFFAAVQIMLLARILTPGDFGLMATSAAVLLATLTISELGLEAALIAKGEVDDDDVAVAWSLTMGRGLLMASAIWISAGLIGGFMEMPLLASLLRVHAWALVLQGAQSPMMAFWMKHLDLRRRVTFDVIRRGTEAAVTITLAVAYRNVWALVIGQLVALAVGCMLSFWMAPFRPRWSWRRSSWSYFLRFGRSLNVTTLCAFVVMTGGELIIGRLQGPAALGFYQVALAIPLLIGARATALLQQISVPTYATLQQDQAGVVRVFDLQMGLVGLIYLPLAVLIAAFAPVIVPLLFGPQWLASVGALRLFCLYAVCAGYASVMASLHYGAGRPDLQMVSWAGQCALYVLMVVPMTAQYGIDGAALALTASYVLGVVLQGLATRRLLGPSADATFWSSGRLGGVVGVLAGAVVFIGRMPSAVAAPWVLALACAGAAGLFGWYLWSIEWPKLKASWRDQTQLARV